MQKPLVSVIVPIYNAQNNIVRCVESIRRQTYENLEILLLNDGSKDVSYPVCEMLSKADARIVLIDKENSGVSATRNLGMRMARGKYLQFVDADDTLEPFATELLVQRAEDNNADLVIAAYNRIVPYKPKKEAKLDPLLPNKKKQLTEQLAKFQTFGFLPMGFMTKEEFACGLMQEPASFYYGVMWNKLYRADLVRAHTDVRCSEEMTWSEDLYFNLTYIRYAERFFALTAPIYNYYDNPGSAVHLTKVRTAITARTALFSYYKELYEQLGLYEENKLQIFKYLISEITGATIQGSHFREKFGRLQTFFRCHSYSPSGRRDQNHIRAYFIYSVYTRFETCFALSRRTVVFTYVKMNDSSTCIYSRFCFSDDFFYSIRNGGILFFRYLCPADRSCYNQFFHNYQDY